MSDPKTPAEYFEAMSRETMSYAQSLLTANTTRHPMGLPGPSTDDIEWEEFELYLAKFVEAARIRHVMKHLAVRAALLAPVAVTIILPPE